MLTGKIVLITGATSGIGLATAKEFLGKGATVIGIGRDFSRTQDLGDNFIPFKCDVSVVDEIKACREFVGRKFDHLDILICNAGIPARGPLTETFEYAMDVLLRHNIFFSEYFKDMLLKAEFPVILHTCSGAALTLNPVLDMYFIAKAALANYVRQCVLGMPGIRVNAVCPGLVRTNIGDENFWKRVGSPENLATFPAHRVAEPEEIAKVFSFLADDKASYIHGAIIPVDGGHAATHAKSVVY